jgi:hypothetical protein
MRAILYCSGDAPMIAAARDLFEHILACSRCEHSAVTEQAPFVVELFGKLDALTSDTIHVYDYEGAIAFCDYWMDKHEIMTLLDGDQHGSA